MRNHQEQEEDQEPMVITLMDSHENTNLETTHHHHVQPPPSLQMFRTTLNQDDIHDEKTHNQHADIHDSNKITRKDEGFTIKKAGYQVIIKKPCSSMADGEEAMITPLPPQEVEESGREKLKRHRVEMAGRVWIPDIWGHEDLLKDWIDCTVFDSSLGNNNITSARAALIQEGRSTLRIENKC